MPEKKWKPPAWLSDKGDEPPKPKIYKGKGYKSSYWKFGRGSQRAALNGTTPPVKAAPKRAKPSAKKKRR